MDIPIVAALVTLAAGLVFTGAIALVTKGQAHREDGRLVMEAVFGMLAFMVPYAFGTSVWAWDVAAGRDAFSPAIDRALIALNKAPLAIGFSAAASAGLIRGLWMRAGESPSRGLA